MQHFILLLSIIIFTNLASQAQCDGKTIWHASHEQLQDTNGKILERHSDAAVLETTRQSFLVGIGHEGFMAKVYESTCNWSKPYKNGKSYYKAKMIVPGEENRSLKATLAIIGKDGKLIATLDIYKKPISRTVFVIDSYGLK